MLHNGWIFKKIILVGRTFTIEEVIIFSERSESYSEYKNSELLECNLADVCSVRVLSSLYFPV